MKQADISNHSRYGRLGDAELLELSIAGDTDAVTAIWIRYAPLLQNLIRGRLKDDIAAEDVLQEVFLAFLRSAGRMRKPESLRAYLVSISMHVVAGEIRRRKTRRRVRLSPTGDLPEGSSAPNDFSAAETVRALRRLLAGMPTRRCTAFVLRRAYELAHAEIAKTLDVSESTVKRDVMLASRRISSRCLEEPAIAQYLEDRRHSITRSRKAPVRSNG